jgi:GDPmannose 4,6-dehydratase
MSKPKTALICGISGQDGGYLANFLLHKGYRVFGTSRDAEGNSFTNLVKLGILKNVFLLSMYPEDFKSVLVTIQKSQPDEIYYLAGQSSVGLSFEQPAETIQSTILGVLNILEACRMNKPSARFYNAGSSEIFGDTGEVAADENTPFCPKSPYAVAKASSYWLVNNYREAYDLFACTGVLFNHESPLRPGRFVTQKIIRAVKSIAQGCEENLELGNLDIIRDWGWAPEYVEAMWMMLQQPAPENFIIATGMSFSLKEFVSYAFSKAGLDWKNHVVQNKSLMRPSELLISKANPRKALEKLGWKAKYKMHEVIEAMLQ